ncbi:MAG TPA: alpha/beta hydrolase domain-containing protein, partial [Rhizomicrobium sp.]|nr:alpha/beta hydrolase domain-containing protein [Rhizomicrobium sp.]
MLMGKRFGFLLGASLTVLAMPGLTMSSLAATAPQVSGPIAAPDVPGSPTHNYIFFASNHDLASHGYVEEEYFIKGNATTYKTGGTQTSGVLAANQPYYTRIVVRRPVNAKRFNGTAIVEWYNVSNYFDAENVWFDDWEDMMRSGYVWVGVSPQVVGVEALKKWNPKRYAGFTVGKEAAPAANSPPRPPGSPDLDAMSFDIFTQVGDVLKHPGNVDPLGGLRPKILLATGQSQAAGRLATYVNNIQPLAKVYDGFLLDASSTPIRNDLIVPVLKVMAEHDVLTGGAATRQPDTDKFREWEIAGTSHMSQHVRTNREVLELRDNGLSLEAKMAPQCANPQIGTRTPAGQVIAAGFAALSKWAAGGKPAPSAPKLNITQVNKPPQQSVVARDADGLALGGIQLASQAVPTQINYGVGAPSKAAVEA